MIIISVDSLSLSHSKSTQFIDSNINVFYFRYMIIINIQHTVHTYDSSSSVESIRSLCVESRLRLLETT